MLFDDPLTLEQIELLRLIWQPLVMAKDLGHEPDWPVWDYLQRSLYKTFPGLPDATEVVTSFPVVRDAIPTAGLPRQYSLIWHTGHMAMQPGLENRVGLTIAGLAKLSEHDANALLLADALASIIGAAAAADARQEPQPFSVLKPELPLTDLAGALATPVRERPYSFPVRLVAELLSHEYAPLTIHPLEADSGHQLHLGRNSLRRYRDVQTAAEYLACIAVAEAERQPSVRLTSPLTLLQTLDYLSLALAADAQWPSDLPFVQAPDLRSAAAVSAEVQGLSDYESALSGLWNLIGRLQVPPVPDELATRRFEGKQPGSLMRLEIWLQDRLGNTTALARARSALTVIRHVGRLRTEGQHASAEIRQRALAARRALGIPDVVSEYGLAWSLITDQLAGALEVIRQEVALAAVPDADQADGGGE